MCWLAVGCRCVLVADSRQWRRDIDPSATAGESAGNGEGHRENHRRGDVAVVRYERRRRLRVFYDAERKEGQAAVVRSPALLVASTASCGCGRGEGLVRHGGPAGTEEAARCPRN